MKFNLKYEDISIYIDRRQAKIKENILLKKATILPKYHKTFQGFKREFNNQRHFNFTFIDRFYIGHTIHINVSYAFEHFVKNTYSDYHRKKFNATLLMTLTKPLLVIKSWENENLVLTFYKAFKDNDNNLFHIVSFSLKQNQNGVFEYKTLYELNNLKKLSRYFLQPLENILYLDRV